MVISVEVGAEYEEEQLLMPLAFCETSSRAVELRSWCVKCLRSNHQIILGANGQVHGEVDKMKGWTFGGFKN